MSDAAFRDITTVEDAHLTPDAGDWAEEKGRLVLYYCDLFASSMKDKWEERVYIDLFAGAGKVRVRESNRILLGSPMLALKVRTPFDRYIYCDHEPQCIEALKLRVVRAHPNADVRYVPGDVNEETSAILGEMPAFSIGHRVLGFCFADPRKLQDLRFSTLVALSERFMDFLIHVPVMDPQRAWQQYLGPENRTVDEFLDNSDWREEYRRTLPPPPLDMFVAKMLDKQMKARGFLYGGIRESVLVRSTTKRTPLYRLGFFSKNKLGGEFWSQAKKYANAQMELF